MCFVELSRQEKRTANVGLRLLHWLPWRCCCCALYRPVRSSTFVRSCAYIYLELIEYTLKCTPKLHLHFSVINGIDSRHRNWLVCAHFAMVSIDFCLSGFIKIKSANLVGFSYFLFHTLTIHRLPSKLVFHFKFLFFFSAAMSDLVSSLSLLS